MTDGRCTLCGDTYTKQGMTRHLLSCKQERIADGDEPTFHLSVGDAYRTDYWMHIEIESASAEALPFADDSFDIVIASLVFCTIPDFDAALSEVARVLKLGGEFRFLEHVRGEGAVGIAHDVLAPA